MDSDGRPTLRLRIPEPNRGFDPAERVRRHLSPAGAMAKPKLDEKVERLALMRKQLVRVLDDDGQAVGPWCPNLTTEQLMQGLRDMMTVRSFDARMLRAHRQGKISFYMQCLGEEAIATAHARCCRATCTSPPIASRACWSPPATHSSTW